MGKMKALWTAMQEERMDELEAKLGVFHCETQELTDDELQEYLELCNAREDVHA